MNKIKKTLKKKVKSVKGIKAGTNYKTKKRTKEDLEFEDEIRDILLNLDDETDDFNYINTTISNTPNTFNSLDQPSLASFNYYPNNLEFLETLKQREKSPSKRIKKTNTKKGSNKTSTSYSFLNIEEDPKYEFNNKNLNEFYNKYKDINNDQGLNYQQKSNALKFLILDINEKFLNKNNKIELGHLERSVSRHIPILNDRLDAFFFKQANKKRMNKGGKTKKKLKKNNKTRKGGSPSIDNKDDKHRKEAKEFKKNKIKKILEEREKRQSIFGDPNYLSPYKGPGYRQFMIPATIYKSRQVQDLQNNFENAMKYESNIEDYNDMEKEGLTFGGN